jgi:hypothetical protein
MAKQKQQKQDKQRSKYSYLTPKGKKKDRYDRALDYEQDKKKDKKKK